MIEETEKLQRLYEALQASKAADSFVKIHWPEYPKRLSVNSPKATEHHDLTIHITVDEHQPEAFAYRALSNEFFNDPEAYYELEAKEGVSTEEIIEVVYRFLADWPYSRGNKE